MVRGLSSELVRALDLIWVTCTMAHMCIRFYVKLMHIVLVNRWGIVGYWEVSFSGYGIQSILLPLALTIGHLA